MAAASGPRWCMAVGLLVHCRPSAGRALCTTNRRPPPYLTTPPSPLRPWPGVRADPPFGPVGPSFGRETPRVPRKSHDNCRPDLGHPARRDPRPGDGGDGARQHPPDRARRHCGSGHARGIWTVDALTGDRFVHQVLGLRQDGSVFEETRTFLTADIREISLDADGATLAVDGPFRPRGVPHPGRHRAGAQPAQRGRSRTSGEGRGSGHRRQAEGNRRRTLRRSGPRAGRYRAATGGEDPSCGG